MGPLPLRRGERKGRSVGKEEAPTLQSYTVPAVGNDSGRGKLFGIILDLLPLPIAIKASNAEPT